MLGFRIPNIPIPQEFRFKSMNSGADSRFRYPGYALDYFTHIKLFEYSRDVGSREPKSSGKTKHVYLPLPTMIVDSNNMKINGTELGYFVGGVAERLSQGQSIGDALTNAFSGIAADRASEMGNQIKNVFDSSQDASFKTFAGAALGAVAASPFASDNNILRAVQLQQGFVRNPHVTAIFEGVELKTFSLQWIVSPRNQNEATTLLNIIQLLKQRMHPELTVARNEMTYPDLAIVDFVNVKSVPGIRKSFIKNMTVSYGTNGMSLYQDGRPVEYQITLELQETDILTRGDLERSGELIPGALNPLEREINLSLGNGSDVPD